MAMIIETKKETSITKAKELIILLDVDNVDYDTLVRRSKKIFENTFSVDSVGVLVNHIMEDVQTDQIAKSHANSVTKMIISISDEYIVNTKIGISPEYAKKRDYRNAPDFLIIPFTFQLHNRHTLYTIKRIIYASSYLFDDYVSLESQLYDIFYNIKIESSNDKRLVNTKGRINVAVPYGWMCRKGQNGNRKFKWTKVQDMLNHLSEHFNIDIILYDHRRS